VSFYLLVTRYFLTLNVLSDLGGTCPENAPSNCTPGPTWSPNGESSYAENFLPCHIVALFRSSLLAASCRKPYCTVQPVMQPSLMFFSARWQMVDKVWYDWQHSNPENAKSYFGGSVQALESIAEYNEYPNGGPPFLNVRSFSGCSGSGS
jgi:tyrosinase